MENLSLYEQIREDILNGGFDKKEKLTELKLAKRYNVSRTPIRTCLQQLESEYLIKDGYVFRPSMEDYRSLFEMRILIEKYAVEKAILLFNDEDIKVLRGYIEAARKGDEQDTMQANKDFHNKIISAVKNPYLSESYERLNAVIYMFSKVVVSKERPKLLDEHEEIVDAIEERNEETALIKIQEHLEKDLEFTLYYLF